MALIELPDEGWEETLQGLSLQPDIKDALKSAISIHKNKKPGSKMSQQCFDEFADQVVGILFAPSGLLLLPEYKNGRLCFKVENTKPKVRRRELPTP